LKELRKIDFETVDSRKEENFKLVLLLIDTMRYTNKPKLNRNKIMGKIIAILAISSNFKIGLKEAQEKYRRAKSREEEKQGILSGYTTQENSPENNHSPEKIESQCKENSLDDTAILGEIEDYIELIRERDKKDKGKRSFEQTFRMIEENLERELNNEERNFIRIMMNENITDEEILEEFLQWL